MLNYRRYTPTRKRKDLACGEGAKRQSPDYRKTGLFALLETYKPSTRLFLVAALRAHVFSSVIPTPFFVETI